ncbi:MAG: hypothetical protein N2652_12545 [Kiritimatiellae bacterium]|nr:hypothetical protein [Kiritimatiellia bacterium]
MKGSSFLLAVALVPAAPLPPAGRAAVPPVPAQFEWRQPILDDARAGERFRVRITGDIYDGCVEGPAVDLRVFDAADRVWPCIVWCEPPPRTVAVPLRARVLNLSTTEPPGTLRLDVQLDPSTAQHRPVHTAVRILLRGDDWIRPVTIQGADEEGEWATVAAGHILRLPHEGDRVQSELVRYSPADFPRLRIRIGPDARRVGEPPSLDRLEVLPAPAGAADPPLEIVKWTPLTPPTDRPMWQSLLFDTGIRTTPLHLIEIEAAGEYARPVIVWAATHPTGQWMLAASESIHRVRTQMSARVNVAGGGRYWRIDIFRGDDPPLADVRVRAWRRVAWLVIEPLADGPAVLHYGAADVRAPEHDLSRRLEASAIANLPIRELGTRERNPRHRPGAVSGGSSAVAVLMVGVAATAILAVIIRLLRPPVGAEETPARRSQRKRGN